MSAGLGGLNALVNMLRPLLERAATRATKIDCIAPGKVTDRPNSDHGANDSRGWNRQKAGKECRGEEPNDNAADERSVNPSMWAQEVTNALSGWNIGEHRVATLFTGWHVDGFRTNARGRLTEWS